MNAIYHLSIGNKYVFLTEKDGKLNVPDSQKMNWNGMNEDEKKRARKLIKQNGHKLKKQ